MAYQMLFRILPIQPYLGAKKIFNYWNNGGNQRGFAVLTFLKCSALRPRFKPECL